MDQEYIHGYSRSEQHRLLEQAAVLAPNVFAGLHLARSRRLLEIGCGVGAELEQIHARWPQIALTGLDHSAGHLGAAQEHLSPMIRRGEVQLVCGDARALPFPAASFDTATTTWMLEHVADPKHILREALRVLTPDGELICTEVDNESFAFDPPVPAIDAWWGRFNRYQQQAGGDPVIGRHLFGFAKALGCRDIRSETLPIISSRMEPKRRGALLDYLESLLLSGGGRLLAAGHADHGHFAQLREAFETVRGNQTIEFRYFAVRLRCRPPVAMAPPGGSASTEQSPRRRAGWTRGRK